MKNITNFSIFLFVALYFANWPKACASINTGTSSSPFRITGYLPASALCDSAAINFDFSRITYLNIAFVNPDENGKFTAPAGLAAILKAAHARQTKVLLSIGGGSAPSYFSRLVADSARPTLVKNIVELVTENGIDGIDADLEGDRVDNNYENFVTSLSASLKQNGKLLTAAVATVYSDRYSDRALAQFDFINVMSYDKTGPWKPSNAGQHAPYDMAAFDLDYWAGTRGIAKEKLGLGLPFYGYGFGANAPTDISYSNLVKQFPGSENGDQQTVKGGGVIYYNGTATIKQKVALALTNSGGIMIWQLMQDATGTYSLLDLINQLTRASR